MRICIQSGKVHMFVCVSINRVHQRRIHTIHPSISDAYAKAQCTKAGVCLLYRLSGGGSMGGATFLSMCASIYVCMILYED